MHSSPHRAPTPKKLPGIAYYRGSTSCARLRVDVSDEGLSGTLYPAYQINDETLEDPGETMPDDDDDYWNAPPYEQQQHHPSHEVLMEEPPLPCRRMSSNDKGTFTQEDFDKWVSEL